VFNWSVEKAMPGKYKIINDKQMMIGLKFIGFFSFLLMQRTHPINGVQNSSFIFFEPRFTEKDE
jgi:hypothetical protein